MPVPKHLVQRIKFGLFIEPGLARLYPPSTGTIASAAISLSRKWQGRDAATEGEK